MRYGPRSYFSLGRAYPRGRLREPYLRVRREWVWGELVILPPEPAHSACPSRPPILGESSNRPGRTEAVATYAARTESAASRPGRTEGATSRASRTDEPASRPARRDECR